MFQLMFLVVDALLLCASSFSRNYCCSPRNAPLYSSNNLPEPKSSESQFGRRDYWDNFYKSKREFSWYSGWFDLAPFLVHVITTDDRILIPGVGSDRAIVDMYDAGFKNMVAFDYAVEGVRASISLLGEERLLPKGTAELLVADARQLGIFPNDSFDAVLDKGTLDAIYLSGGHDKHLGAQHLQMADDEFTRVVKPGGKFVCLTAVCVDAVKDAVSARQWNVIRDGSIYITEEGFASNQVDGNLLIWERNAE